MSRRPRLARDAYVEGVLRGDRTILSQAITLIESLRPEDIELAQDVLEQCLPYAGDSIRVGITGVPGVGKSSLIEVLGAYLTAERGEKVAVLAVDPSSQVSRGSILGDKTRMETLANDERAFIRPSPSGGSLGGVARRTRETMKLCEAAGYRNVLVETVGVGQSETAVRDMVDFFLLLMLAGAGDELQGMKRGIVEMTDLIAFNKADGDNRAKAEAARREYENALHLFSPTGTGWAPRVITCSARAREGIAEIWEAVLEHNAWLTSTGQLVTIRQEQVKKWMYDLIEQALRDEFLQHEGVHDKIATYEQEVLDGRLSPYRAVRSLIRIYTENPI
ncbi:MAG TPA: methylmalonyl Co-A mutase-associated GTPase MeaB [Bryobacteraceae bacterium]|jgi:LAO/AO transport system kinase|nr:methylmalonyl Co-A mutase-associated GTPase MeaB [Bryobacteraceae bacterium]